MTKLIQTPSWAGLQEVENTGRVNTLYPDGTTEPPPPEPYWSLPTTINIPQSGFVGIRQYLVNGTNLTISVTNLPTGVTYNSGTESLEGAASGTSSGTATFTAGSAVDTATVALVESGDAAVGNIFNDDFETGDLSRTENGFSWGGSVEASVSSEQAKSGAASLRFRYPATSPGGDSFSEQRFSLGGSYSDVWIKYDLFVPSNYIHRQEATGASNNKGFVYLWSGDYGSPTGPGMGPNFWPVGNQTGPASTGGHYVWGPGLDRHYWNSMPKAIEEADRGKWVEVILHYKYATAANNDGVAEAWKTRDGVREKIMDIQDGAWYVAGQPGFNQGYLFGWANSGFDEETTLYIDNFAVSTQPLL